MIEVRYSGDALWDRIETAVEKVKDFQNKLTQFLQDRKAPLMEKIRNEKAFSDALSAELKAAVVEFKQSYR